MAQSNFQFFSYLYQQGQVNVRYYPNARFRYYQVRGNLAVFQVGAMAYCIDMDGGKILWQHTLFENMPTQPQIVLQQVLPDAEGNLEVYYWNQMNAQRTHVRIGQVAAVQASYVALVTQKGLTVLDPLRGKELVEKTLTCRCRRVFGDDQYLFMVEEGEGGAIGAGRVVRAIDGSQITAPDFGGIYPEPYPRDGTQNPGGRSNAGGQGQRQAVPTSSPARICGTASVSPQGRGCTRTEDPGLTGVIEPDGKMTVIEVDTGRILLETNVLQGRVGREDIVNLQEPLLLQDRDRFYLALNQPIDGAKVAGSVIGNNFGNGLRCRNVNGWLLAFFRGRPAQGKTRPWSSTRRGNCTGTRPGRSTPIRWWSSSNSRTCRCCCSRRASTSRSTAGAAAGSR